MSTESAPLLRRQETFFFLGYMLLPLLGLVSVAMGVWSVIIGKRVLGLVLILVLTQIFVWGAVWCIGRRRKLLQAAEADVDAAMSDQEAIDAFHAREALELERKEREAAQEAATGGLDAREEALRAARAESAARRAAREHPQD